MLKKAYKTAIRKASQSLDGQKVYIVCLALTIECRSNVSLHWLSIKSSDAITFH